MGISFLVADSSVTHNKFGAVTGLVNGFDMFSIESGEEVYLLKKILTVGNLIAQSGGSRAFGTGADVSEVSSWAGNQDAALVYFDLGAVLPPEGLRIGRGTADRLVLRIKDNFTGITATGEFSARVFGFKKFP